MSTDRDLIEALQNIVNVLGPEPPNHKGVCHACQYEIGEAFKIATDALSKVPSTYPAHSVFFSRSSPTGMVINDPVGDDRLAHQEVWTDDIRKIVQKWLESEEGKYRLNEEYREGYEAAEYDMQEGLSEVGNKANSKMWDEGYAAGLRDGRGGVGV